MKSIRTFAYAALLMFSALAIQPNLAAAEDARGHFTLTHEVFLQKQALPAGEYTFSLKPAGPGEILLVQRLGKSPFSAMVLVGDVEVPKPRGIDRLVLVAKDGQSYISAIELPRFDMVLRFKVPSNNHQKRITASASFGAAAAAR